MLGRGLYRLEFRGSELIVGFQQWAPFAEPDSNARPDYIGAFGGDLRTVDGFGYGNTLGELKSSLGMPVFYVCGNTGQLSRARFRARETQYFVFRSCRDFREHSGSFPDSARVRGIEIVIEEP